MAKGSRLKQVMIAFEQLHVNAVETNSGIFIATHNTAHGWSAHSKTNSGFGRSSDTTVSRCVSIVIDNDLIDAPINDADQFTIGASPTTSASASASVPASAPKPIQSTIAMKDLNVNAQHTNSTISVGEVEQIGWSSHGKSNSGTRGHKGANVSQQTVSVIFDNDWVDAPIDSPNLELGAQQEGRAQ